MFHRYHAAIVMLLLASVARAGPDAATGKPTPIGVPRGEALISVRQLLMAYRDRDLEYFARHLAAGFRDHPWAPGVGDSSPVLDRDAEIASAAHLFRGVVRDGHPLPAAKRMAYVGGPFFVRADADRPDSLGRFQIVVAMHLSLVVVFEDGTSLVTPAASQLFHVARADVVHEAARGDSVLAWLVTDWSEGPPDDSTWVPALAKAAVERPQARPIAASQDTVTGPTVLALAPVENPAHDRFTVDLALPAAGPVRLEAFDVMGRRVMRHELDGARGVRRITIEPERAMGSGVYWLRASHAGATAQARVVLIR
ncbi:MAG: hypothetical protein HYR74_06605 [Candidatus Eisenbacteria bacterium]|nr:hypothetical protein [Candidatus Eisenbacteria bacterium]